MFFGNTEDSRNKQRKIKKEEAKMAQKKVTKIKVRDLKPNKDAKGGLKIVYAPGSNK